MCGVDFLAKFFTREILHTIQYWSCAHVLAQLAMVLFIGYALIYNPQCSNLGHCTALVLKLLPLISCNKHVHVLVCTHYAAMKQTL